jgi:hypothetical protein
MTLSKEPYLSEPWKIRFWSIFIGQAFSLIGSGLTQFVLIWWITDTTGSVAALGRAGLAASVPMALLGPIGGVFADRYSRQLIMAVSDLVSAACMVVLMVRFQLGTPNLEEIYTMIAIRSAMQAFQIPASTASMAMLVPSDFLPRAAGLNQMMQGVTVIGAAPLGAFVMSIMPVGWALGIDVLTAAIGITPLLFVSIPQKLSGSRGERIWHNLRDGINAVCYDRPLRTLYVLATFAVLTFSPLSTMIPVLVKNYFGGGASDVAMLESSFGIGMIFGGGIIAWIAPARKMLWVLVCFTLTCFLMSVLAVVPHNLFWLAVAVFFVSSMINMMGYSSLMALLQSTIPNAIQGRVLSLFSTVTAIASPFGLALATPLGEFIGIQNLYILFGVSGGLVVFSGFIFNSVFDLDHRSIEDQVEVHGKQNSGNLAGS